MPHQEPNRVRSESNVGEDSLERTVLGDVPAPGRVYELCYLPTSNKEREALIIPLRMLTMHLLWKIYGVVSANYLEYYRQDMGLLVTLMARQKEISKFMTIHMPKISPKVLWRKECHYLPCDKM